MRQIQVGAPPVYMGQNEYLKALSQWTENLARELEEYTHERDRTTKEPYSTENVTLTRTYDANATTTAELADVLGSVIADLKQKGVLR